MLIYFFSKDQYTKDELKDILPYLKRHWDNVSGNFSMVIFFIILFLLSFVGYMIPVIIPNWITNSSIIL